MHDMRGQACQPAQRSGSIKIAQQRCDVSATKFSHARAGRRQRHHVGSAGQQACHAKAHVAAANDQNALTAKACGQRAKGV